MVRYDEAESVWVWEYLPEGEEETHDLFMDPGEQIRLPTFKELFIEVQVLARRFRVTGETFVDTGPKAPLALETEAEEGRTAPYRWATHWAQSWNSKLSSASVCDFFCQYQFSFSIVGSCSEPGLGLLSWWS